MGSKKDLIPTLLQRRRNSNEAAFKSTTIFAYIFSISSPFGGDRGGRYLE
jgi:hypothetical protein